MCPLFFLFRHLRILVFSPKFCVQRCVCSFSGRVLKNAWHTGSWSGMPRSKGGQGYYTKISAKNDDGDDDDDGSVSLNVRPYTGFSFSYSHNVL